MGPKAKKTEEEKAADKLAKETAKAEKAAAAAKAKAEKAAAKPKKEPKATKKSAPNEEEKLAEGKSTKASELDPAADTPGKS